MPSVNKESMSIPLHGLSLDLITFSAMSYFASEMEIPLNEAIALALKEWLSEADYPQGGTAH